MATFTLEGYNSYSGCDILVTAALPSINGQAVSNKYYSLGSLQTLSISTHQDKRPVRSLGVINAKDYVMGPRTIAGSMVFAVFNKHFATEMMKDLGASGSSVVLPDEIPALNITVNFANEYGRMSRMAIYGVKIINEGQVMSINDLYTENTYQFVALGLEPLNVNVNSNTDESSVSDSGVQPFYFSSKNGDVVITDSTSSVDTLLNDKNYNNNSGSNLSTQIRNNKVNSDALLNDYRLINYYSNVELTVRTEQPDINDTLGLAIFTLTPKQNNGAIFVYNNLDNTEPQYTINVSEKNNYVLSLPIGSYTAQYIAETSDTSNSVEFSIERASLLSALGYTTCYPIVEKVTNKSITISSSDYSHAILNCYKSGGRLISLNIGKKPVEITGLEPGTEYNIYTAVDASSAVRSEIIVVKTYETEDEELKMLKKFIIDNEELLITLNTTTDLNFENVSLTNYNTLIDYVLTLPESDKKQEMLIYANQLTKQLVSSHNEDNRVHIMNRIQSTPFDSVIEIDNFEKANFYNCDNYRITLNSSIVPTEEKFFAKPNKHYYVYGVSDDESKSVKQDFIVCKNSSYQTLQRYCDVEKYKNLNYDNYIDQYRLYDYNTIEALTIRDNCFSDINVLEPPYIYQSDETVYADVRYLTLKRDETYYLVCEELYSALDYIPHRKVSFTMEDEVINLKDHYLGLVKGKKYLFWIENKDYLKLSRPFLFTFETDDNYVELQAIQKQNLYSGLLGTKKEFIANYGNKTVVNDLFDYIMSCNPADKNLEDTLSIELISQFNNSLFVSNTLEPFFEAKKIIHKYNDIKNLVNIEIDTANRTVKFDELNGLYICAIHYDDNDAYRLYDYDNTVNYEKEGYTFIFLITNHMLYKSGFILIENAMGRYRCTDDLKSYIKEVGVNK